MAFEALQMEGQSNQVQSMLVHSGAKILGQHLDTMTNEQADRVCDFINETNARLCAARNMAPIDSRANGSDSVNRNDWVRQDDARALSIAGQATE
jgi:hypothetical protein